MNLRKLAKIFPAPQQLRKARQERRSRGLACCSAPSARVAEALVMDPTGQVNEAH